MNKHSRLMASAAFAGAAVLLSACAKTSTAPTGTTRTETVTTTASIPANPTAPITVATSNPQSQVSVTIPPAALQLFAAAPGGGATTITMSDLSPQNYNKAPAGYQAAVPPSDSTVAIYTFSINPGGSAQVAAQDRAAALQPANTFAWPYISATLPTCGTYNTHVNYNYKGGTSSGWLAMSNNLVSITGGGAAGSFFLPIPATPVNSVSIIISCSFTGGITP